MKSDVKLPLNYICNHHISHYTLYELESRSFVSNFMSHCMSHNSIILYYLNLKNLTTKTAKYSKYLANYQVKIIFSLELFVRIRMPPVFK